MTHQMNVRIAARLRQMSSLLEHQGETGFRAQAYRRAADVVERLGRSVDELLSAEGREGLVALPAVGEGIASAIAEMITTGRWSALDRLTGQLDPEELLMTVPGIGPQLAHRLHNDLHIETLEGLEQAAHEGRLDQLSGFGEKRLQGSSQRAEADSATPVQSRGPRLASCPACQSARVVFHRDVLEYGASPPAQQVTGLGRHFRNA